MDDEQWCTVNWLNSWKIGWIGYCALLSQGLIVKCRYASARIPSSFTSFFSYSFSFSSSSFNFCQQQRLMQKARRLSAGALWSISFNPLHLSSLPPHLSLLSVPLQSGSLAFLILLLLHASPLRIASRPYSPRPHMLVGCKPLYGVAFFPVSIGQTSPTNPSPPKSAQPPKISILAKCCVLEIRYISTKY